MRRRRRVQLELPRVGGWGGARAGAGRKLVATRPSPPHRPRPRHMGRWPVHVTLRAREGLPSLRSMRVFPTLQRALSASTKPAFRVVHFSVQSDHVHLVVEGDQGVALVRGLQGLACRCAKAVNRAVRRRGHVWSSREQPIPCPRAPHAHRGSPGPRLRPFELQKASSCGARRRPAQLGTMVHRLAQPTGVTARRSARRSRAYVAGDRRLASSRWTHRLRRTSRRLPVDVNVRG